MSDLDWTSGLPVVGGLISAAGSLFGSSKSKKAQEAASQREYERQKEFAQNGIRWKVEDAKAAGIHPLYALGANTSTYSPQAAVGNDYGLSQAGQDIGRAIEAGMTHRERQKAAVLQTAYNEAQVEHMNNQNELLKAQTDAVRQGIINDALYNNPDFATMLANASQSRVRTQQNGAPFPVLNPNMDKSIPEWGFAHDEKGRLTSVIPGDDMAQRTEDKFIIEWLPWIGAAVKNLKARFGSEVGGYWWHGEDKGYLPYPPKKSPSSRGVYEAQRFRRNPYR